VLVNAPLDALRAVVSVDVQFRQPLGGVD